MAQKKRRPLQNNAPTAMLGTTTGKPLAYPASVAERYRREVDALIREMAKAYKSELKGLKPEGTMDASVRTTAMMTLTKLRDRFSKLFAAKAPSITEQMLKGSSKASSVSLQSSLKEVSQTMTIKTDAMPPTLLSYMKDATIENVSLIKSIQEQYHGRVVEAVLKSIQPGGEGRKTITQELMDIDGMSLRRAKIISADQTRKVTTASNTIRLQDLGVRKFKWLHSGGGVDKRPLHVQANGKIFSYDNPPNIGDEGEPVLPGQSINCHPGELNIDIAHGCVKLYRRRYSGELLTFVTDNGIILKATPNHPILTSQGWKPAKSIDFGDYLVKGSHQRINVPKANVKNPVTTLSQFFDAAFSVFGGDSPVGASTFEFHGDVANSEVDIVNIGRHLPIEGDIAGVEHLRELILSYADAAFNTDRCSRSSSEFIVANLLTSDSRVGSLCAFLSELRGESSRAKDVCFGLISDINASALQDSANWSASHAVFLRNLQLANSCDIFDDDLIVRQILAISARRNTFGDFEATTADSLGEIIRVDFEKLGDCGKIAHSVEQFERVRDKSVSIFSDHVYNLETDTNWYVAEGIVSHNCRCQAVPVIEWGE